MNRLTAAIQTDITVQIRNRLYIIGPVVSLISAFVVGQIVKQADFYRAIPVIMLMILGGTTTLYVAGLIIFERDEGTINALIVSPLTNSEYLTSKVFTLTLLATLEGMILVGIVTRFQGYNLPLLLLGILVIGVMYTLIGVVMIVRYKSITDFLIPVIFVAGILQMPFLHFIGLIESNLFLLIPTSAPTMLMQGAWVELSTWEWIYALGYSVVCILILSVWAMRAFYRHIVVKVG